MKKYSFYTLLIIILLIISFILLINKKNVGADIVPARNGKGHFCRPN